MQPAELEAARFFSSRISSCFSIASMYPRIVLVCLLIPGCASLAQAPANGSNVNASTLAAKECGINAVQVCALHVNGTVSCWGWSGVIYTGR